MKVIKLILIFCLFTVFVHGQVNFDNSFKSWDEVLIKAKKLNKPVFVDIYTKWCGPCKKMDKEIFSLKEAGAFYNSNLISLKIDAEEGWGKALAQTNKVNSYPTFLYFSPKGDLLVVETGFKGVESLLKMGLFAIKNHNTGTNLKDMQAKIDAGNTDPKFLLPYIKRLSPLNSPNALLIEKYLEALPQDSLYSKAIFNLVTFNYK